MCVSARVRARTVCYINHLQRGNLSAIDLLNLFVNIKFSRFINLPQVPSVFVDSNSSRVEFELNARVLYSDCTLTKLYTLRVRINGGGGVSQRGKLAAIRSSQTTRAYARKYVNENVTNASARLGGQT